MVLKGARTVVADPDGPAAIIPTGNPGMATGGTGDVLAGLMGALLAGGMRPREAARVAAWVHGRAGDIAASRYGERGMVAGRPGRGHRGRLGRVGQVSRAGRGPRWRAPAGRRARPAGSASGIGQVARRGRRGGALRGAGRREDPARPRHLPGSRRARRRGLEPHLRHRGHLPGSTPGEPRGPLPDRRTRTSCTPPGSTTWWAGPGPRSWSGPTASPARCRQNGWRSGWSTSQGTRRPAGSPSPASGSGTPGWRGCSRPDVPGPAQGRARSRAAPGARAGRRRRRRSRPPGRAPSPCGRWARWRPRRGGRRRR